MIKWFKTLFRIVRDYDKKISLIDDSLRIHLDAIEDAQDDAELAVNVANAAEQVIRERTEIHADIHYHAEAPHQVVVIGKYKGGDYVQAFGVYDDGDLKHFIEMLKGMERYGEIKRLDAPIQMRSFLEYELGRW
jgi:hypothetical protein